jgi:3-methyladenine DNA glycosylase/8-oxoguanine DNA glycosylase
VVFVEPPPPRLDVRSTLAVYRFGRMDATTRLEPDGFWRATLTPDGPATMHLWRAGGGLDARAWGPGREWLLARAGAMCGDGDAGAAFGDDAHPAVRAAARDHQGLRLGRSEDLYHELLPVVIAQRITAVQAIGQWRRLCLALGAAAPGPRDDLRLPPEPAVLAGRPAWWFHPMGIEAKRANALRTVAKHAARLADWSLLPPGEAAAKLALLPGIGPWTIGSALGPALGDPDAVPVGDYHIPNMVAFALAGEPRATDARMLELLAPYAGQRGRVIRLLAAAGHGAPAFGPRRRILPMQRW